MKMRLPALLAACLAALLSAPATFAPARFRSGTLPPLPAMVVGGGEVVLEVTVNREGHVTEVTALRSTQPFTAIVIDAVRTWQFSPAAHVDAPDRRGGDVRRRRTPLESKVLVAAVFRPPALNAPTLGEIPKDVAAPSDEIPYPLVTRVPPFPPRAYSPGVVLIETRIGIAGAPSDVEVIRSAPPFDDPAVAAVRAWHFRPARIQGAAVETLAYVLFGFPVPVSARDKAQGTRHKHGLQI